MGELFIDGKTTAFSEKPGGVNRGLENLLFTIADVIPEAPEWIVFRAQSYLYSYNLWEAVRKNRGPKLLGKPEERATGYEGWLVGPDYSSDQVEYFITRAVQKEFDRLKGESRLKRRMENVLFANQLTDLGALKRLEIIFLDVKQQLPGEHIITPKIHDKNEAFRRETMQAVAQVEKPLLSFDPDTGRVFQNFSIPDVKTPQLPKKGIHVSSEWLRVSHEIGIVGHPIIRTMLQSPALISYLELRHPTQDRVNLAPSGSPVYVRLKNGLAHRFIEEMTSKI